jgi:hypothetical protein
MMVPGMKRPIHSRYFHTTRCVRLEPDDEWKIKMSSGEKTLVTAITFPLLLAHGYVSLARATGSGRQASRVTPSD